MISLSMENINVVRLLSDRMKLVVLLLVVIPFSILGFVNGAGMESFVALLSKLIIFFLMLYIAEYIATKNKSNVMRTILIPVTLIVSFLQFTTLLDVFVASKTDNYFLSISILLLPPLTAAYILIKRAKEFHAKN